MTQFLLYHVIKSLKGGNHSQNTVDIKLENQNSNPTNLV